MPVSARVYDTERTERMLREETGSSAGRGTVVQPGFNMPVTVVNNGSEKLQATTRATPDGSRLSLNPWSGRCSAKPDQTAVCTRR